MNTAPNITVIMPVFNRQDTIEKAIGSVLSQDFPVELIIVDGGSSDNTVRIIQSYEKYLSYWHSQKDKGAAHAANMGIKKASGELITFLMADDWYEANTFHKVWQAYQETSNVDMLTIGGRIVSKFDQSIQPLQVFCDEKTLALNFYNVCKGVSAICCRFIKRDLFKQIGLFIDEFTDGKQFLTNDKEFLLRCILQNINNKFVPYIGYTYLAHQGSYSFSRSRHTALRHCKEHMHIAKQFLQKQNVSLRRKLFLKYWYHEQALRFAAHNFLAK